MILKNADNQVFMLRRFNTGWRDGWWTVPSGHVDAGEGPKAAAIRELNEEAGVEVMPEQLGDPLIYFYLADDRLHERVSVFFEIDASNLTPSNVEPAKADKGEWFDLDALPDNVVPLLKRAFTDLASGVRYSERYYDSEHHQELL
jgi:8-oxo-dGTP pyrophosphatase MutT (NUDIX family)